MPKGSKKRKADKKKKEKASNAPSPTNCQGSDDPKSHDEKDSDGGELGSPLSQDNTTNNHALVVERERMEREEQEKRDSSSVEDNKSKEGSANGVADGNQKVEPVVVKVIEVVSDSKRDENGDSNGKGVDVVEFVKESLDGGSSGDAGTSGISSSSDEESRRVEKTNQVTELGKFEKQKGAPDTTEAVPYICSAAPVVAEAVTSKVIEITGASDVIESETVEAVVENSGVVEITSKVGEEKTLPSSDEKAAASSVCNLVSAGDENKILPVSDENAMASSGSNMVSVDKTMQLPKENDVVDGVTELRSAGNENKMIRSLEENTRTSSGMAGEDKILPVSDKHAMASSGSDMVSVGTEDKSMQLPKENEVVEGVTELRSAGNENKNNLLKSSGAPGVETSNVREHGKDTTIPESSESQPLIASAPQIVKRTSWTNCCGLFDVLMGSNR